MTIGSAAAFSPCGEVAAGTAVRVQRLAVLVEAERYEGGGLAPGPVGHGSRCGGGLGPVGHMAGQVLGQQFRRRDVDRRVGRPVHRPAAQAERTVSVVGSSVCLLAWKRWRRTAGRGSLRFRDSSWRELLRHRPLGVDAINRTLKTRVKHRRRRLSNEMRIARRIAHSEVMDTASISRGGPPSPRCSAPPSPAGDGAQGSAGGRYVHTGRRRSHAPIR